MPIKRGRVTLEAQNVYLDNIIRKLEEKGRSFTIATVQASQEPHIVYCSDVFCGMVGYKRNEILQRSSTCTFLFGILTATSDIRCMNEAVFTHEETKISAINLYKKDGLSLDNLANSALKEMSKKGHSLAERTETNSTIQCD